MPKGAVIGECRVLMLAPNFDPRRIENGFQVHISDCSRELAKCPHIHLTILSCGRELRDEVIDGYHLRIISGGTRTIFDRWWKYVQLLAEVMMRRPDIIHLQGSAFDMFLVCAILGPSRRTARIVTIHGHPAEEGVANGLFRSGGLLHLLNSLAEWFIVNKFNHIVCVTNRRKEELVSRYGEEFRAKISVVPNGVDASLVQTAVSREFDYGCVANRPALVVISAKSLVPYNGQEYLLRAFRMVIEAVPDAKLILAGDGWQRPQLESIASDIGVAPHVDFVGWIPNAHLHSLLRRATISVVCSVPLGGVEEGSSMSILEAMALGIPVIATKVGGSSEVIDDGVTGILVPPADPIAMSTAIMRLWNDPAYAERIASSGREYIARNRTWSKLSESYWCLYKVLSE